ncbi:MAG TPA: helix-turn-helix transcriptional regulator [Candidatus Angelobacter sp.]|nr:helix-turn-helix transcriptional regulator [Candidatus Angelobacter sp.]
MSNLRHIADPSIKVRSFGVTFQSGQALLPHPVVPRYLGAWHQLVYATRGVMTVRTERGAWVVPPHRGAWIPAGSRYQVELSGVVAVRNLYIKAKKKEGLFQRASEGCFVVNISPLLRELIVRINLLGALDEHVPEQRRLLGVLFDELKTLSTVPLQLPSPRDPRAAMLGQLTQADPGATMPLKKMLRQCGASRRTMERIFSAETGMSLGQWLRRQRLLDALRRLGAGACVNTVALELGYNSSSAFIAMFRRELGQTPKRYCET